VLSQRSRDELSSEYDVTYQVPDKIEVCLHASLHPCPSARVDSALLSSTLCDGMGVVTREHSCRDSSLSGC
jgi:hypothetical protein